MQNPHEKYLNLGKDIVLIGMCYVLDRNYQFCDIIKNFHIL